MISERIYQLTKATYRKISLRVDLLDFNMRTIGDLEGNVISGSINVDANADIRRTADITMVVTDSSFDIGENRKIWLDRYVQIYVGMSDVSGATSWINMRNFLNRQPNKNI